MRVKDELKQEALFEATVKLVNKIGFASSSVSKIAREAKVSPATIYIYFQNKEDLLVSTYKQIKQQLSEAILQDFDENGDPREVMRQAWHNAFKHVVENYSYIQFSEQFSASPYAYLVNRIEVEHFFLPLQNMLNRAKAEKILKDVPSDLLGVFLFFPIMTMANPKLCENLNIDEQLINQAFDMAWDAVKR